MAKGNVMACPDNSVWWKSSGLEKNTCGFSSKLLLPTCPAQTPPIPWMPASSPEEWWVQIRWTLRPFPTLIWYDSTMQLTTPDDVVQIMWLWILYLKTSYFWQNKALGEQGWQGDLGKISESIAVAGQEPLWFSREDTPNHQRPALSPALQWPGDHYSLREWLWN